MAVSATPVIGSQHFNLIFGPRGCGKTTTVRLALGLAAPQKGTLTRGASTEGA